MHVNTKQRRRHSAAFKAEVLAACAETGASVAAVAMAFKLNDNLVHQWRRGRGAPKAPGVASKVLAQTTPPQFIELTVPTTAPPSPVPPARPPDPTTEMITLEFKRGALGVSVTWPVSAAADCATWLREVLR
ncbi:TPA: transposase [Stenotrophomonas maltophilia]|jgi:transposase|uniref:IS66-like element accessory protein TnpA n=1 Tax=Pseudomonas sp. TaxID=306 RepID=UPI0011F694C3|nr:transposase [Pseudomonas sp.]RZI67962.1 MAG: transposase [Pseudomonas sp.]HDS1534474.1 transposase [Stenotrophomonas maltophilia]